MITAAFGQTPAKAQNPNDQVSAQSFSVSTSPSKFSATYLYDGLTSLVGITYTPKSIAPNLDLNLIAVTNASTNAQYYFGTLLTYNVPAKSGTPGINFGIGLKGIDLTKGFGDMSFATKAPLVFSVGITIPLKT